MSRDLKVIDMLEQVFMIPDDQNKELKGIKLIFKGKYECKLVGMILAFVEEDIQVRGISFKERNHEQFN